MFKISRPTQKDACLRHRLFKLLDKVRCYPVIWVSAPAGSGKTTLISSYIETEKNPCLWYKIDNDDEDITTFFYYMGQAVKKIAPRKRKPMPLLTPEYLQGIPAFTRRYFEELFARLKGSSLIVFDNYQEVYNESSFHEMIHNALLQIPDGINVVVISRSDPPDALIRLKANGQMAMLRWEDIRLTEDETREVVSRRDKELDTPEMIGCLHHLSDGWAAGLVLISGAVKRDKINPELIGRHSFAEIFTYFTREAFSRLDNPTQAFFLTTAFFPQMTVRMAEELTGNPASGNILNDMNRNNYFIARHLHAEAVYEYHPLYRDFLITKSLQTFSSESLSDIRRCAAVILEKIGQTESAIALLRDNRDIEKMTEIIITHASEMVKQGRYRVLQEWLSGIPDEIIKQNPWLLYWKGMSFFPFSTSTARFLFEEAFAVFKTAGDTLGALLSGSGVINAIAYNYDDLTPLDYWYDMLDALSDKIYNFPSDEIEASVITAMVTASKLREIEREGTERWERRAMSLPEKPDTILPKFMVVRFLFWDRLINRSTYEASILLNELRRLSRLCEAQPLISITILASEVQYHLNTGLHDELIEAVKKGLETSKKTGVHIEDMWFYSFAVNSSVSHMDYKGAQTWLDRIPHMAKGWPNWAKTQYHLQLMRIALIREEHSQALYEGKLALDFATKSGSLMSISASQLLLAQLFWKMGKREDALKCLEHVRFYAVQKNSNSFMTVVLMNDAQFAFDQGDNARGFSLLRKAIALARELGHLFSFYDDPTITARMCEKALEAGIEVEYVQEIIRVRGFVSEKPPVHIENWPWAVKIYTLGRFEIIRDDRPVRFSKKAPKMPLRLLKVLIALGGREIAESSITDLLWPDAEGDMAHQSLRINLHRLRNLFELPEAIRFSDGKLTLDNRYCWVDIWAFELLIEQANESVKQNKIDSSIDFTEKAIGLYRGRFLAEESEELWMLSASERLRTKLLRSVLWLGSQFEGAGLLDKATACYERCLEVDDLFEDIYRQLMICYKNLGKKSSALSVYQRCKKRLSSGLGIDPSPETEAVLASLYSKVK